MSTGEKSALWADSRKKESVLSGLIWAQRRSVATQNRVVILPAARVFARDIG